MCHRAGSDGLCRPPVFINPLSIGPLLKLVQADRAGQLCIPRKT